MMTPEMLTGQTTNHLTTLTNTHRLQPEAVQAFSAMQKAAHADGLDLQPASTFRDFTRQQNIWNNKFYGKRPVLDQHSQPIDVSLLSVGERCNAILRWSALPGASRHHWGTDLDVYDPSQLPAGYSVQLVPSEYSNSGYFASLSQWLTTHMAEFGFYRPFINEHHGVAVEPWHLSYRPLAQQAESMLTPELLLTSWQNKEIAGKQWLEQHLPAVFSHFIPFSSPFRKG